MAFLPEALIIFFAGGFDVSGGGIKNVTCLQPEVVQLFLTPQGLPPSSCGSCGPGLAHPYSSSHVKLAKMHV